MIILHKWKIHSAVLTLMKKDQARCDHEWARWDGSETQGVVISDRQSERLLAARALQGLTAEGLSLRPASEFEEVSLKLA